MGRRSDVTEVKRDEPRRIAGTNPTIPETEPEEQLLEKTQHSTIVRIQIENGGIKDGACKSGLTIAFIACSKN